jgi:hypothetical protein
MAVAASSTQLGCGRDIDQVWDHLHRAPDAHELTCPFCQAARDDLGRLASATRALRDDDAGNPDLEPGAHVLDRILTVARAEVRRGRRLPLDRPTADQTSPNTVSEQAVTAVIRRIGDQNSHVQIRRCALTVDPDDTAAESDVGPGPAVVAVSLRVSVEAGRPIAEVSDQLRASVIDIVAREVGMHVISVDITVEDIHDA